MRNEYLSIQALRGVAACMVLVLHLVSTFGLPSFESMNQGVEIFFCISGFVMYVSTYGRGMSARSFLRRRLIRVVPLYWIFLSLYILETGRAHYGWKAIAASYLLVRVPWPILAVGWTLTYEMFFYLCFAGALALKRSPLWLIPPFMILSFWQPRLLCFLAGMLIGFLEARGLRIRKDVAVVILFAYVFVIGDARGIESVTWYPVLMGGSCLVVLAGVALEYSLRKSKLRLPLALGDASYVLYLSHPLILHVVDALQRHLHPLPGPAALPVAVLCCCLAIWLHSSLEKPMLNWLNAMHPWRKLRALFLPICGLCGKALGSSSDCEKCANIGLEGRGW